MSLKYTLSKKILHFKQPAGTSRGVYTTRKIWLVHLTDGERKAAGGDIARGLYYQEDLAGSSH